MHAKTKAVETFIMKSTNKLLLKVRRRKTPNAMLVFINRKTVIRKQTSDVIYDKIKLFFRKLTSSTKFRFKRGAIRSIILSKFFLILLTCAER